MTASSKPARKDRLTIYLPEDLAKRLRLHVAIKDSDNTAEVAAALEAYLPHYDVKVTPQKPEGERGRKTSKR